MAAHRILVPGGSGSSPDEAATVRWCRRQHTWFSARQQEFNSPTDYHAAVAQHLAEHPSEAREVASSILAGGTNQEGPVRIWVSLSLFHSGGAGSSPARGTPRSGSSVGESAALIQRRPEVQSLPGLPAPWPCRAVGSSPPCHGGGRGFKPRQGRHGELAHSEERCPCKAESGDRSPDSPLWNTKGSVAER